MKNANLDRRMFLKKAAGTTAVVIGFPYFVRSSALGKAGNVAASNRITLGMIGIGNHGRRVNLKNFLGNSDAQVVAVCDVDTDRLNGGRDIVNKAYGNQDCATYNDFRDVLARPDIDAVMISTPDHWHVPMSIAAAKAGKDVECEKPTLTVREGRVLCDVIKRYGRIFQTSTEDRSIYVYHRMAELVRNGRIGKLHTIHVHLGKGNSVYYSDGGVYKPEYEKPQPIPEGFDYDLWLGPAPWAPYTPWRCHRNFRWIQDYSGGRLADWGAHLIDTAQWANDTEHTGPVQVDGKGVFPKQGLYDTAIEFHIEYKYANGVRLIINSEPNRLLFEGTEGWVGNRGWRRKVEASSESILNSFIGPNEIHLYTCLAGEQRNFLDCVHSRKQPYFPAEIGHRMCTIMHIGNISMLLGRKLQWDPEKELFVNDAEANRMLSRSMRSPWHL